MGRGRGGLLYGRNGCTEKTKEQLYSCHVHVQKWKKQSNPFRKNLGTLCRKRRFEGNHTLGSFK